MQSLRVFGFFLAFGSLMVAKGACRGDMPPGSRWRLNTFLAGKCPVQGEAWPNGLPRHMVLPVRMAHPVQEVVKEDRVLEEERFVTFLGPDLSDRFAPIPRQQEEVQQFVNKWLQKALGLCEAVPEHGDEPESLQFCSEDLAVALMSYERKALHLAVLHFVENKFEDWTERLSTRHPDRLVMAEEHLYSLASSFKPSEEER